MGRFSEEAADLDLELVHSSDAAWLVKDGNGTEAWLPKSQVEAPSDWKKGQAKSITVPNWLIEKSGLE